MQREAADDARDWLAHADRDLLAAQKALAGVPLPDDAAFDAQQAAEKALKAFLAAQDHPFPKTHDLLQLVKMCSQTNTEFVQLENEARVLTPYAVRFRYPPSNFEPEVTEAQRALELARFVVQFVRNRLPRGESVS